jgi:hypothetical protein
MDSIKSSRKTNDNRLNEIAAMDLEVSLDTEESVSEEAFA